MCWSTRPLPINALKADEEPKYIQPMMNIMTKLKMRLHTGTSNIVCISLSHLLPIMARSLARDHVKREAVCCAPMRANTAAQQSKTTNTVAATSDCVAWYHISKIGTLDDS